MAKVKTRGKCVYCGRELSMSGMAKHLPACPERLKSIESSAQKSETEDMLYLVQVQDAWGLGYWLQLEISGSALMSDLDQYLRAIWLEEFYDHMSQFSIDGWKGEEIPMEQQIKHTFMPGIELTHIYNFCIETRSLVKMMNVREGTLPPGRPIVLMARNNPMEFTCAKCDNRAVSYCLVCDYEFDQDGFLCTKHMKNHAHDGYDDIFSPIYNSPRMGMSDYCGPAEPPY